MFYVLHDKENFSVEDCRSIFNKLLYIFDVATLGKTDMIAAMNDETFSNLEDSMQHQSSVASGLDYIVTRNKADFAKTSVSTVTPEEFLVLVHAENV